MKDIILTSSNKTAFHQITKYKGREVCFKIKYKSFDIHDPLKIETKKLKAITLYGRDWAHKQGKNYFHEIAN
jgi:hypothetical protein